MHIGLYSHDTLATVVLPVLALDLRKVGELVTSTQRPTLFARPRECENQWTRLPRLRSDGQFRPRFKRKLFQNLTDISVYELTRSILHLEFLETGFLDNQFEVVGPL